MIRLPSSGKNVPYSCNVIIEISAKNDQVKYEFDKDTGLLCVDRFIPTSMVYPCNYGFIPGSLSGDGDPVDVLVHASYPILPGSLVEVRPIGVFITEDEKGVDSKIMSVPLKKIDPFLSHINNYSELPAVLLETIQHFFEYYKKLEKEKWVKIVGWRGVEEAYKIIEEGIKSIQ
ncbi:inorganic pyrophosphatase [Alphaproteobacteria bacterium]